MLPSEPLFDVDVLRQRRNRWADHAEAHDFLLQRVGEDLANRLQLIKRQFSMALVIGAYHGVVGREIGKLENVDWVVSAETADQVLAQCPGSQLSADVEWLPIKHGALDLIVSPLTLQFANDLPGALLQIRTALKKDGLLLAALFGGETLTELRQSWLQAEAELTGGAAPRVIPMADMRDIGGLLQRAGFALPVVDTERLTVTYASPLALMREVRAMAASNPLVARSRTPVTKTLLTRACEIYSDKFANPDTGRIRATFEVLTLSAWAPDESQQKPLKPGTATMRLADALDVKQTK